MRFFNWVLFIVLSIGFLNFVQAKDLPYLDSEFDCISQSEADSITKELTINIFSFGGLELCNSTKDTKKLFNDIQIIKKGQFSGEDSNSFIKNWVSENNYYNWLVRNTRSIRRGHDIPNATAYNSGGNFTMQDGWALLSTLGRVGTLIHEARHTEGYRHFPCKYGPYSDTYLSGCDFSIDQGGSHAVEMEYYSRVVLRGKNFHPAYQTMARLMNLARANFVFNKPVMTSSEMLLAASATENKLITHDSLRHFDLPIYNGVMEGTLLKRSSSGGVLLTNKGKAWVVDLYSQINKTVQLEDNYSYYKILKSRSFSFNVVDVEEFDIGVLRVLMLMTSNGHIYRYNYRKAVWYKIFSLTSSDRFVTHFPETGRSGLFIVTKDNQVYTFNLSSNRFTKMNANWPTDVLSAVQFNNKTLLLGTDGTLRNNLGQTYKPFLKEKLSQIISVPAYDAYNFKN